ncbi:SDR family oxidoreductase [Neobacillus sp. DY30]|uniref:SDR family oxidoreductase n=1 Tax=Neobacillus sp. DY30 TaxID=3047871 RepID=UPI0024BFD7C6|nr:SDR family oxidoreductase [Neobacillus sp. DY30]WHX98724.1 SDR family oxidoreductase [Neobacillus sp. DY30]
MTKILVTGSTGNIGCHVVEELIKRDGKVKAAVTNLDRGKKVFSDINVELVEFDFLRKDTYPQALEGVSKIFLMRPPHLAKPKEDMLPFLNEAKKLGVNHIVFVSLLGVEKKPVVPHRKIEDLIRNLEFQYTFLRPSFFMQNLNTTHREDVLLRNELFMPVGKAKTSFIDTRDIAEVAAVCLTEDGHFYKAYTLTGSEAITYYEAASIMSDVLKRKITYQNPGIIEFRKKLIARGTPRNFANVMTVLYTMTRLGNAKNVTDKVERLLKRKPITFRQYVKDYQHFFKNDNGTTVRREIVEDKSKNKTL